MAFRQLAKYRFHTIVSALCMAVGLTINGYIGVVVKCQFRDGILVSIGKRSGETTTYAEYKDFQKNEKPFDFDSVGFPLDDDAKNMFESMEIGKHYSVDSLAELGYDTSKVVSSLTIFEIAGAISKLPGGFYKRLK